MVRCKYDRQRMHARYKTKKLPEGQWRGLPSAGRPSTLASLSRAGGGFRLSLVIAKFVAACALGMPPLFLIFH
jgi:hypothetical protein